MICAFRIKMARMRAGVLAFALIAILAVGLAPFAAAPGYAQNAVPPAPYAYTQLEDPAQEAQAAALMQTLRCLKCQSQSIADSDVSMAGDMRHQVRVRIAAGQSPDEVRAWLVERYGDYVSYQPEVNAVTWPLFVIPAVLFGLVLFVLLRRLRRSGSPTHSTSDTGEAA